MRTISEDSPFEDTLERKLAQLDRSTMMRNLLSVQAGAEESLFVILVIGLIAVALSIFFNRK